MQEWILIAAAMLATGCFAGILAGLFGIGGGVVIVPVLEAVLGLLGVDPAIRMHIAVGTSLATIVPTSISSARAHYRRNAVDFEVVKRWALFVLGGALAGAWIASQVHSRVLAAVFASLALFVAVKMVLFPKTRNLADAVPQRPWVTPIPAAIGFFSSMMGTGGGIFSVIALTVFGVPIHRAVGTASLFGLVISLPATLGYIATGWPDPRLPPGQLGYVSLPGFLLIAPVTALAAPLGARVAHAIDDRKLTALFGLFLVVASARLFYRALS